MRNQQVVDPFAIGKKKETDRGETGFIFLSGKRRACRQSRFRMAATTTNATAAVIGGRAAPSRLYRKLIKMYIRKFDTDHNSIIRAWKQTKHEFYFYRSAPPEQVPLLLERGLRIHDTILGGLVPLYEDPKSPAGSKPTARYSKEMLQQTGGIVDPVSAEEFVRRNYQKMDPADLSAVREKLQSVGRWNGPVECRPEDVPQLKVKRRKVKCTDPDDSATAQPSAAATATTPAEPFSVSQAQRCP